MQDEQKNDSAEAIVAEAFNGYKDHMREYRNETTGLREACLAELRTLGVQTVTAFYNGCGDSGQIEEISLEPVPEMMPDGLTEKLDEIVWRIAYQTNPGFEINEGGNGDFEWSVNDDKIQITHRAIVESESSHEDI